MKVKSLQIIDWKSFADSGVIELGAINLLVGRNNSGKSAILRALYLMQNGAEALGSDVRLLTESRTSEVRVTFDGMDPSRHLYKYFKLNLSELESVTLSTRATPQGSAESVSALLQRSFDLGTIASNPQQIPSSEPHNYIYPYLARRKVQAFDPQVDSQRTIAVNQSNG